MQWEKRVSNNVTDKSLISKTYKQLIQLNSKNKTKQTNKTQLKNEEKGTRLRWQDRRNGVHLLSSKQQNYHQMLNNLQQNGLETFKKDILLQETKRRPHQDGRKAYYVTYTSPWASCGQHTDWKGTMSQRPTYRSESSESHIGSPYLGVWHWEKEPPEHLALRVVGLLC